MKIGDVIHSTPEPSLLIHVGLHKCASTWLQSQVFGNKGSKFDAVWGRMSAIAVSEFVGIEPLAFSVEDTRARLLAAAQPTLDPAKSVWVMSHEALSSRPHHGRYYSKEVADRVGAVFPSAKVLLVIREQKSIIRSLYTEHVRNGGRNTLEEFLGAGATSVGFRGMIQSSFFEYDRLIEMYRNIFGVDNVLALPVELLKSSPEKFTERIYSFVGLEACPILVKDAANTGWDPITVELYRRSNGLVRRDSLGRPGAAYHMRERIFRKIGKFTRDRIGLRAEDRIRALIASQYRGVFEASNARTALMIDGNLSALGYAT